jgi:hypothetical protein
MMSETRSDAYGYNDRSELTNAVKDVTLNEYAYQYDDIGNRMTSLDLGTNRTYTGRWGETLLSLTFSPTSCEFSQTAVV